MSSKEDELTFFTIEPNWDAQDIATHDIQAAVGSAISTWSFVEYKLLEIYLFATHQEQPFLAGVAAGFNAVVSFNGKLEVVSAILRESFNRSMPGISEFLKTWGKLSDKCRAINRKRNEIAHGATVNFTTRTPGQKDEIDGPYWVPYYDAFTVMLNMTTSNKFHAKNRRIKKLSAEDIAAYEQLFKGLHDELDAFRTGPLMQILPLEPPSQLSHPKTKDQHQGQIQEPEKPPPPSQE